MKFSFAPGWLVLAIPLAAALVLPSLAHAQAPDEGGEGGRVYLLPLGAQAKLKKEKKLLQAADAALREGAAEAMGESLEVAERARSARCSKSPRCVGKLAKRAGADKGAAFVVKKGKGKKLRVQYLVASAGGDELLAGIRDYDRKSLPAGLKQLVLELLVPASLSGILRVPDLDAAAWVTVDGVPMAAEALAEGIALGLGQHEVIIVREELEPEKHGVEIQFGEESSVTINPAPPAKEAEVVTRMPWWPAVIAGTATASFAAVSAMFMLDFVFSFTTSLAITASIEDEALDDNWFPAEAARQKSLIAVRQNMVTDAILGSGTFVIAAIAAIATGALVAGWLLGEPGEGKDSVSVVQKPVTTDSADSDSADSDSADSDSADSDSVDDNAAGASE